MAGKSAFQEDLARYRGSIRWNEPALWSIAAYRLGRRILQIEKAPVRRALLLIFFPIGRLVETISKVSLPAYADIGGGLRIESSGIIFVHANAKIGHNCTLQRGVTIGNTLPDGPTPIIGDNVEIGAYAQILGGIRIGDGARIARMAVVLVDVPPGAFASGIPAKVIFAAQNPPL